MVLFLSLWFTMILAISVVYTCVYDYHQNKIFHKNYRPCVVYKFCLLHLPEVSGYLNSSTLRKAKIVYNFFLSECNRVKVY